MRREFRTSRWGAVSPASGWTFGAGLFTGGVRVDLFAYHARSGSLWVGQNTGSGLNFTQWAAVAPDAGWEFVPGDFAGSGDTDVVGFDPATGVVQVGENRGGQFRFQPWASVQPASGWRFCAGFFTGGARADLFAYHRVSGSLWVGANTGSAFDFRQWASVDPGGDWQFVAADFTGNGRTDVAGYDPRTGSITVGENTTSAFRFQPWASVQPASGWQFDAGTFTRRAKADLFGYHPSNGSLWVGENTGSEFVFDRWATVAPADGWQFVAGGFDGDLWVDVIGHHSSDGSLWLGRSATRPIEGYCWPLSAAPGQHISFMTSEGGASTATINRHTSMSEDVDSVAVGHVDFVSASQPVPAEVWRTGCGWDETFRLDIPVSWRSGIYSASCLDAEGERFDITFIVKPAANARSRVAVLGNVNTWLAYNGWGGQSKYSGLARCSFLRPMPVAAPGGDAHLTRGELWVLGWLESAGYRPDVFSDIDFHAEGCDPGQYACLVVGTHPEYWTTGMLDNLDAYLDGGGSFAYLGGNGLFESGEYEPDQTGIAFRQGIEGGPRVPALFRALNPPRHERGLLGVATERCAVLGSPYQVQSAGHPVFDGTGVANGDLFGEAGLNTGFGNGKASAWEVDTVNGPGATSVPWNCAITEPAMIAPSTLPPGLTILATGTDDGVGQGADMTYYDHPGGGFVFSAGSITFGGSLVVDATIQQIMRNLLTRAGVQP